MGSLILTKMPGPFIASVGNISEKEFENTKVFLGLKFIQFLSN
jgi:hypothetical protein